MKSKKKREINKNNKNINRFLDTENKQVFARGESLGKRRKQVRELRGTNLNRYQRNESWV